MPIQHKRPTKLISQKTVAPVLLVTLTCPAMVFGQNGSLFHASDTRGVQPASGQYPVYSLPHSPGVLTASANGVQRAQAVILPAQNGSDLHSLNQQAPRNTIPGSLPLDTMSLPPVGNYPGSPGDQQSSGGGLSSSWTFIPPAQTRRIKIHDIVSIRVDESANSLLLGNATSRKTTTYDAVVRDWVRLSGLDTLKPSPQSDGDPRAQINQNEVYRGDSTLRTSESISFNIASQVVDILPNGLIVLEGNTTITLNDNSMEVSLIGTCRSEDIAPDNTVLSRNLVNKHIKKREDGHVRDGYSRGWLTRLFAKIKPF